MLLRRNSPCGYCHTGIYISRQAPRNWAARAIHEYKVLLPPSPTGFPALFQFMQYQLLLLQKRLVILTVTSRFYIIRFPVVEQIRPVLVVGELPVLPPVRPEPPVRRLLPVQPSLPAALASARPELSA